MHYYAISTVDQDGRLLFWSGYHGWIEDWRQATRYTSEERNARTFQLPPGARGWVGVPPNKGERS